MNNSREAAVVAAIIIIGTVLALVWALAQTSH